MSGDEIAEGTCALLQYTSHDEDGKPLDRAGAEPIRYVHGLTQVVPGLYRALAGRRAGDAFEVRVEPAEGYGAGAEGLGPQPIPRGTFPEDTKLTIGMQFGAETPDGQPVTMFITDITEHAVFVDNVHPFAGKVLVYQVEVVAIVRPA